MTNKIIGGLLVLSNVCYFIPKTINVIWTGGKPMGYGLLIVPMLISLHAFLLSGLLAFIDRDRYPRTSAILFSISLILLFLGGLLSLFIPIIALFTVIPTLLLATFGISKYSDRRLTVLNICGLLTMINSTYILWRT